MRARVLYQNPSINHYEILGLDYHASQIEIRTSYKELVKIYHPDLAPIHKRNAYDRIFKTVTEAYAVLSRPETRKAYDKKLIAEDRNNRNPADLSNDNLVEPLWRKIFRKKG